MISRTRQHLPPSQKADILRTLLILLSICILVPLTDVSKIYHSIRGQDTIKLYVIFNALEVRVVLPCFCALLYMLIIAVFFLPDRGQAVHIIRTGHPRLPLLSFYFASSFTKAATRISYFPTTPFFLFGNSIHWSVGVTILPISD